MLQLCKVSNTRSKPIRLVLRTIIQHDPTSHLVTVHGSDLVIYSDTVCVISLRIINIIIMYFYEVRLVENHDFSYPILSHNHWQYSWGYFWAFIFTARSLD